MRDLDEERYRVAEAILSERSFSVDSIMGVVGGSATPQAVYCVLGETIAIGLVRVARRKMLTSQGEIVTMFTISDLTRFEQYVLSLRSKRFRPDQLGKPTGLNFRLASAILQKIEEQETPTFHELTSLNHYIALAQLEERELQHANQLSNPLTEAHLRVLFAKSLTLQKQWANSIEQFLIAGRQFRDHGRDDTANEMELNACRVLINKYESLFGTSELVRPRAMIEFSTTARAIIEKLDSDSQEFNVFVSLTQFMIDESRDLLDCLSLRKGERLYFADGDSMSRVAASGVSSIHSWLSSLEREISSGSTDLGHLPELVDQLDLLAGSVSGSQKRDMMLRMRIRSISSAVKLNLALQSIRSSLKENDFGEVGRNLDSLLGLEFDGQYPYYLADALEAMKFALGELVGKWPIDSPATRSTDDIRSVHEEPEGWVYEEYNQSEGATRLDNLRPFVVNGAGDLVSRWHLTPDDRRMLGFQKIPSFSPDDDFTPTSGVEKLDDRSWLNDPVAEPEAVKFFVSSTNNYDTGILTVVEREGTIENEVYQTGLFTYAGSSKPYDLRPHELQPLVVTQKGK